MIENLSPLTQGAQFPGSLRRAQNFEPGDNGGYRRVQGFEKYDTAEVPGTGKILGVFAFRNSVIACRGTGIYESTGNGWTLIHTQPNQPEEYIGTRYNWVEETIALADGVNNVITYNGTDVVTLPDETQGAVAVQAHVNRLWVVNESIVTFSAPTDATNFDGTGGSGAVNTGSTKNGLAPWRNALYVFGPNTIDRITGTSESDFTLEPITDNIGTVSGRSIKELSSDLYFVSHDGVRTVAGTDRLGDVELGNVTRQIEDSFDQLNVLDDTLDITAVVIPSTSQIRVFAGDPDRNFRSARGLLGGIRLNSGGEVGLEWFRTLGFNAACSDSDIFNNEELAIFGDYEGFVYRMERGNTFDGEVIAAYVRFPYWPFEDSERRKTIFSARLFIDNIEDISPSLGYDFDFGRVNQTRPPSIIVPRGTTSRYGEALYGTARYSAVEDAAERVNLVGSGNNVSFTLSSRDTMGQYTIQQLVVEYALYGRR